MHTGHAIAWEQPGKPHSFAFRQAALNCGPVLSDERKRMQNIPICEALAQASFAAQGRDIHTHFTLVVDPA